MTDELKLESPSTYTQAFEDFWKAYPKNTGKKPAFKVWQKLKADAKRAALSDVEKRNRQGGFNKSPRLIPNASTYLNQARWEDDWESDVDNQRKADAEDPSSRSYCGHCIDLDTWQPYQVEQLPWPERTFGRLMFAYIVHGGTVPDTDPAEQIKAEMMRTDVPALQEDVDAGACSIAEAATQLGKAFLQRLDSAYRRNIAEPIFRKAQRQQWGRV